MKATCRPPWRWSSAAAISSFVGFHFHCLSNHHDAPAHARLVAGYLQRARRWAGDAGLPLRVVNAGGGIGVDYAQLDRPFDWAGFCAALAGGLEAADLAVDQRGPSASASSAAATSWRPGAPTSPRSST